jgi:hypothetical protein
VFVLLCLLFVISYTDHLFTYLYTSLKVLCLHTIGDALLCVQQQFTPTTDTTVLQKPLIKQTVRSDTFRDKLLVLLIYIYGLCESPELDTDLPVNCTYCCQCTAPILVSALNLLLLVHYAYYYQCTAPTVVTALHLLLPVNCA